MYFVGVLRKKEELSMKTCWATLKPIEERLFGWWVLIDTETRTCQPIWVGQFSYFFFKYMCNSCVL